MKIIGKTDEGFLISAESKEIARLIGFYSEYEEKYKQLTLGDEINMNAMYEQLSVEKAGSELIIGCPFCHASYCDWGRTNEQIVWNYTFNKV